MEDDPHLARRLSQDYDFGVRVKEFHDEPKYWTNPMVGTSKQLAAHPPIISVSSSRGSC